jgi:hypothetical protein
MKITSFEWTQELGEEISDFSSQSMASATIDFAFIDLELERAHHPFPTSNHGA